MLMTLMYHRCGSGKHSNSFEMLRDHLSFIKENYPVLLPGDPIPPFSLALCLTFDDATFDFYHYIYPLLQKLNLRAILGVPVQYILDKTNLEPKRRLAVPYTQAMQEGIYESEAPFCSFEELSEMSQSGLVEIASHSYSHANLTYPYLDLNLELARSKEILEQKIPQTISTFIYPFGKCNGSVHQKTKELYPYAFRIGSRLNFSWDCTSHPLFRIPADNLTSPTALFSFRKKSQAFIKSLF